MTVNGLFQIGLYLFVLILLVKPLGWYMARVYESKSTPLDRVLGPVERLLYRLFGVHAEEEMDWKTYAIALLLFSAVGLVGLYLLERVQGLLPLNPQRFGAVAPDLSLNTAVSFTTNTNWQNYGGETTMSYLTQICCSESKCHTNCLPRGNIPHRCTSNLCHQLYVNATRSRFIPVPLAVPESSRSRRARR